MVKGFPSGALYIEECYACTMFANFVNVICSNRPEVRCLQPQLLGLFIYVTIVAMF